MSSLIWIVQLLGFLIVAVHFLVPILPVVLNRGCPSSVAVRILIRVPVAVLVGQRGQIPVQV